MVIKMYEEYIINMRKVTFDIERHIRADRLSPFGNPYIMYHDAMRDIVCDNYHRYFHNRIRNDSTFKRLIGIVATHLKDGKKLACWCKPARCHCDTIIEYLIDNKMIKGVD